MVRAQTNDEGETIGDVEWTKKSICGCGWIRESVRESARGIGAWVLRGRGPGHPCFAPQ